MIAISARGQNRENSTRGESLRRLSDSALLRRLEKLRGSEPSVLVEMLDSLNDIERRRLYVPRGYATLYEFCTHYLEYSRSAAMRRIHAARCIARFPQVARPLRSGELTLTAVSMIAGMISPENADEVISCAVKQCYGKKFMERYYPREYNTAAPLNAKLILHARGGEEISLICTWGVR